jgi:hypothetical protein
MCKQARQILMTIFDPSSCSVVHLLPLWHTRTHLLKWLKKPKRLNLLLVFIVIAWLSDNLDFPICFWLLILFSFYLRTLISMSIRFEGDEGVVGGYFGYWLLCWCCFRFWGLIRRWHCFILKRSIMLNRQLGQQWLLRSFQKSDALLQSMLFWWFPFSLVLAEWVETGDGATRTSLHSYPSPLSHNISRIWSNWREIIFLPFITLFRPPEQL